jgi:hypothetical protein
LFAVGLYRNSGAVIGDILSEKAVLSNARLTDLPLIVRCGIVSMSSFFVQYVIRHSSVSSNVY